MLFFGVGPISGSLLATQVFREPNFPTLDWHPFPAVGDTKKWVHCGTYRYPLAQLGNPGHAGGVNAELRPSLSIEQVRDPLGTLALAYGVKRDRNPVRVAIAQRLYPDDRYVVWDRDHPLQVKAEWRAVSHILAQLTRDGRYLARVFRGSQLPKAQRQGLTKMVAACGSEIESEILIEQVFAEIRSALTPHGPPQ
jgi:hypothetical protein